jgi:16S rRNA (cytidine1402-2'-O)-methyltransferase
MERKNREAERNCLVLVGTPIGNLEDITLRALRELREADLIAAEDTRTTRKLLSRYDIHVPMMSYCGARERDNSQHIVNIIREGKRVVLVSESGMPGISDPGWMAVRACREAGIDVEVVPGPSALTSAVSLAGLPPGGFYFGGFLPARSAQRRKMLQELSGRREAQVFYEAPHRIKAVLEDLAGFYGERTVVLARELTKLHEEVRSGTAAELLDRMGEDRPRGEFVLLVEAVEAGDDTEEAPDWEWLIGLVGEEMAMGSSASDACRTVATLREVSRRELYNRYLAAQRGPGI